jgi:two-component system cell cycle sensor histidine kinase/response regulator CckA
MSGTILIVDDNDLVRDVVREYVEQAGYETLVAGSVAEALAVVEAHGQVDVLITDLVMPDGDGFELATRLVDSHSSLRVLFTSGYTNVGWTGAFLAKPFTAAELVQALDRLTASHEAWMPVSHVRTPPAII